MTGKILNRSETLVLMQTLKPESSLYSELNFALIHRKLTTLSNGIKVNTTLDDEKLLGGNPDQEDNIREIFIRVIEKANSLNTLSKEYKIGLCNEIHRDILALIEFEKNKSEELKRKKKHLEQKLIAIRKAYVEMSYKLKDNEISLKKLMDQKQRLEIYKKNTCKKILSVYDTLALLQKKINEEDTKRINLTIDWIPGVAFFGSLYTEDYNRMIPFYSLYKGIESLVSQKKESLEKEKAINKDELRILNENISNNDKRIRYQEECIVDLKCELKKISDQIDAIEKETNFLGKKITDIHGSTSELQKYVSKLQSSEFHVNTIENSLQQDLEKGFVQIFLNSVKQAQKLLLKCSGNGLEILVKN